MTNKKFMDITCVISLTLVFLMKSRSQRVLGNRASYSILIIWIAIALLKLITTSMHNRSVVVGGDSRVLKELFKINNIVRILIYLYTIFLVVSGLTEERFLSTNIQTFVNGISAVAMVYLFKERAFKNGVIAVLTAYFLSPIIGFVRAGNYSLSYAWWFLEQHDLAFSIGLVAIYYICSEEGLKAENFKSKVISIMFFLLAHKRIGIVALIAVLIYWKIGERASEERQKKLVRIGGIIMIVVSFWFVYAVLSDVFWNWSLIQNINMQGRDYYYRVFAKKYDLSLTFIGLGRNAIATMFEEEYAYMRVGNIHSDILRMYLENGFVLFCIWLWNYLIFLPKKLGELLGSKMALFAFITTAYMFVVYFTDNTELYFGTQFFYMLVIIQYAYDLGAKEE